MPTRTKSISNARLVELSNGIAIIDRGHEITVDGKNVARGFNLPASVLYTLARTGIVIKPLVEAWRESNTKLFEANQPIVVTDKDGKEQRQIPAENMPIYDAEVRKLLAIATDIELPFVHVRELKVGNEKGQNPIPATALTLLDPILDWSEPEA